MQWEYIIKILSLEDTNNITVIEEFLRVFGTDGWELVTIMQINYLHWYIFKRAV